MITVGDRIGFFHWVHRGLSNGNSTGAELPAVRQVEQKLHHSVNSPCCVCISGGPREDAGEDIEMSKNPHCMVHDQRQMPMASLEVRLK